MHSLDSDSETYVVTESVIPLSLWLKNMVDNDESHDRIIMAISWGFLGLLKAVAFLNGDCKLCHGAISCDNVLVTRGGDWKLGGFFVSSDMDSSGPSELFCQTPDIVATKYKSPERIAYQMKDFSALGIDIWATGAVLHGALNFFGGCEVSY